MNEAFNRKYRRVLEVLPDVAECAKGKLALVGGTALALFYLNHRVSVDLDFVQLEKGATKEELKGCLSKRGYRTARGAFKNQFIIQFEDTGIKVEVLGPEYTVETTEERVFGGKTILVASREDLLRMKIEAYGNRKEARDLFDIFVITKDAERVRKIASEIGKPKNLNEIADMALNKKDSELFKKVLEDAA